MYSPILELATGQWLVGEIDNHEARPLTKEEVEEVCKRLNENRPVNKIVDEWFQDNGRNGWAIISLDELRTICDQVSEAAMLGEAIVRLRDTVLGGWAIDTEDGMFCQYCGAEVKPEHEDDNSENVLKGGCKYECEHGADCVVLIAPDVVPVLGEAATTDKAASVLFEGKTMGMILSICVAAIIHKRDKVPLKKIEFEKLTGVAIHDFDGGGQELYYAIERAAKNEAVSS